MGTVTVYSIAKMEELLDTGVVGASIVANHLILELRDGSTVDAGDVLAGLPVASATVAGVTTLATDAETITGTSSNEAVTPLGLAALTATVTRRGLVELATDAETATGTDTTRAVTPASAASRYQPLDSDLTAIAGIGPSNDSIIQRKSGAWVERTMTQLAADISGTGEFLESSLHNGTVYADADNAKIYIGPSDPAGGGSIANGSVWYDTTGA